MASAPKLTSSPKETSTSKVTLILKVTSILKMMSSSEVTSFRKLYRGVDKIRSGEFTKNYVHSKCEVFTKIITGTLSPKMMSSPEKASSSK
jgi:hypothetical protein